MLIKKHLKFLETLPTDNTEVCFLCKQASNILIVKVSNPDFMIKRKINLLETSAHDVYWCCALSEFLKEFKGIHGSRNSFQFLPNGEIEVYVKKDKSLQNTIKLPYTPTAGMNRFTPSQIPSQNQLNTFSVDGIEKMLGVLKNFKTKLEYFKDFNDYKVLQGIKGIDLFGSNGIHSCAVKLSNEKQSNRYWNLSEGNLKVLIGFIESIDSELYCYITENHLCISSSNNEDSVYLLIEKTEFYQLDELFDINVAGGTMIGPEIVENVLSKFDRTFFSQYRKTHDVERSEYTACRIQKGTLIVDDEESIDLGCDITYDNPLSLYYVIEFLKACENKKVYISSAGINCDDSILIL